MDSNGIDEQIHLKITTQLYRHAAPAIYSTIFNTLLVSFVFRNTLNPYINFAWTGVTILYLIGRLIFTRSVLKMGITSQNDVSRLRQFAITICFSGILFGSAGIFHISPDQPGFNAFIYFLMGGMFAGSMGAFAIKKTVFYLFSAPIMLPVTIHFFILGGEINLAMAFMGIIYIFLMIAVVTRMNLTIVEAIRLGIVSKNLNEELIRSNNLFQELSYRDALTKIKNRRFINDILNNEIERYAYSLEIKHHHYNVYGIFIIDIDHFKNVNDTWGHKCGDEMLIQFVKKLGSLIRKDDILARWGGEEFLVVLKKCNLEYLDRFAKKIIDAISTTQFKISGDVTISKTCSLGYTSFPFIHDHPRSLSLEQTIDAADRALYFAKTNGRNQAVKATISPAVVDQMSDEEANLITGDISRAIEAEKVVFIQR